MTKTRAYTDEFGFEKITAWSIMQERNKHGGKSLSKTYWSLHDPGHRKPMRQVQNKLGTTFFAYKNAADEVNGEGGGESLTHQLFKEALAGLSGTKLKLGSFGEYDITITRGETEKKIQTVDGPYYADAYWQFSSTGDLGLRWSGEVYLEVHHTHEVPLYKQESLSQARFPVIECDIPKIFEYTVADENTTDPLEAAHVRKIQNMLKKGFLPGHVISDRRTVEYLEQEVDRLEHELHHAEKGWSEAMRKGDAVLLHLKTASEREASFNKTIGDLTQQAKMDAHGFNDLAGKLAAEKAKVGMLSKSLSDANEIIKAQQKEIRIFNWILWSLLALMLILCAFLLYRRFIAPHQDNVVQAVSPSTVEQVVPAPGTGKARKASKLVSQAGRDVVCRFSFAFPQCLPTQDHAAQARSSTTRASRYAASRTATLAG